MKGMEISIVFGAPRKKTGEIRNERKKEKPCRPQHRSDQLKYLEKSWRPEVLYNSRGISVHAFEFS